MRRCRGRALRWGTGRSIRHLVENAIPRAAFMTRQVQLDISHRSEKVRPHHWIRHRRVRWPTVQRTNAIARLGPAILVRDQHRQHFVHGNGRCSRIDGCFRHVRSHRATWRGRGRASKIRLDSVLNGWIPRAGTLDGRLVQIPTNLCVSEVRPRDLVYTGQRSRCQRTSQRRKAGAVARAIGADESDDAGRC
ncbi:hypothetical protein H310_10837 [Aphanomyces invadans]|uniref:Uncharacterized protein n=1 Tax=Aphanomyces invadans TaxID=157072 RepID=A0A024TQ82_9STRA|nr:hypothetical protein H310_10837 [Aphanomyces invadans]ETV95781.1 hypothetical protein H310_10837 [Aphanomyces invadans]|eukprot:XP_008875532.1 hypothetical protein H310_10837 [Aphanomyces invadans]